MQQTTLGYYTQGKFINLVGWYLYIWTLNRLQLQDSKQSQRDEIFLGKIELSMFVQL